MTNDRIVDEETLFTIIDTPVGELLVTASDETLTGVSVRLDETYPTGWVRDDKTLRFASKQLTAYFAGKLKKFDLPLRLPGTPFQQRVWMEMQNIPYAEFASYGDVAARIGHPRSSRAVGNANGRNPICIVIPSHRVIASGGRLGGYGDSGLDTKKWLIAHERRVAKRPPIDWPD